MNVRNIIFNKTTKGSDELQGKGREQGEGSGTVKGYFKTSADGKNVAVMRETMQRAMRAHEIHGLITVSRCRLQQT